MNAGKFTDNFTFLINAPEGLMRVRELILQFAFTADLTFKADGDTPASVIFEKCQQVKDRRIEEGKIGRQLPLEDVSISERPWKVPGNWKWCRLGQVTTYGTSEKVEFENVAPETWVLELEDIEKDTSRVIAKIRAKERQFRSSKNRFYKENVLYGKLRPYLDKVVLADEDGVFTTEIIPISVYADILPQYLRWFLKSPFFKAYATASTHGMNLPRMGTEAGRNALFPLAPVEEQERIVTKVDELMALCDELEAKQQERKRSFPVLSKACHSSFAESPTQSGLNRIFDKLGSVSPADVRKTLLVLAVRGVLIPQQRMHRPVEETFPGLKRIELLNSDETDLPESWAVCTYQSLTSLVTSGSRGWKEFYAETGALFVRTQNIKTDRLVLDEVAYVQLQKTTEGRRTQIRKEDILITITGANVTKAARVEEVLPEAYVSQHIALTRPKWHDMSPWLHLCFISHGSARGTLEKLAYGDKPGLNLENIRQLRIPVPPLAEQRGILAKVNELMSLIDQLERQQLERDKVAGAFAKACVASFTNSPFESTAKMKPPQTRLTSDLVLQKEPSSSDNAPLAVILQNNNRRTSAKQVWIESQLNIGDFYQQLKSEIAQGWIAIPEVPVMEEVAAN